jgi:hypothetical protein
MSKEDKKRDIGILELMKEITQRKLDLSRYGDGSQSKPLEEEITIYKDLIDKNSKEIEGIDKSERIQQLRKEEAERKQSSTYTLFDLYDSLLDRHEFWSINNNPSLRSYGEFPYPGCLSLCTERYCEKSGDSKRPCYVMPAAKVTQNDVILAKGDPRYNKEGKIILEKIKKLQAMQQGMDPQRDKDKCAKIKRSVWDIESYASKTLGILSPLSSEIRGISLNCISCDTNAFMHGTSSQVNCDKNEKTLNMIVERTLPNIKQLRNQ